ncbi:hypothetical protein C7B69_01000 [filamentous cyanobacterium Phorm 46]|nr:hypothetical protein C7B69_01000 [filamentous cyanobacterium Phorm 46]
MAELSLSLYNAKEIGKDNPVAISAVVNLIASSQQERTHWMLADYLGEIATNNSEAISALVNLIGSSQNETTQLKAATSLGKIEKDNSVAINTLVNLMRNSQDEFTRSKAIFSLREIVTDNPVAETLVELIGTFPNPVFLWTAADILGKIDKYNQIASEILVKLIREAEGKNVLINATGILNKIGKDSANGIVEALVEIMENTQNDLKRDRVVWCLANIAKDKQVAIEALVNLINKCDDENILLRAAGRLGDIHKNNPVAVATLVKLISTSQDKDILWGATGWLGDISKNNPVSISALVELIRTSCDEHIRCQAAESLEKIDKDNPLVITTLVELIRNSGDKNTRSEAAYSLSRIMKGKHLATAVSGLKDYLNSEIYDKNSHIDKNLYQKIIWNCAENMTYPEFHQAWHTQPTNSPIPDRNHRQNTDIPTLLKQLQPTDKTWVVPLNIRALEGETDTSPIAQELCTQLYQTIFPADTDIPAIRNAPEFKRLIPQLKNRLQKQHIALILHSCPCEDALSSFTRKLADTHMGIHIAWITDTPLELPLTGFPVDGDDLLDAVQDWIAGIGA